MYYLTRNISNKQPRVNSDKQARVNSVKQAMLNNLVGIRTEVVDEGMIIPLPRSCTSEINHPKRVNEKCSTRSMEVKLLPESFWEIRIMTDQPTSQWADRPDHGGVISLPIIKEK